MSTPNSRLQNIRSHIDPGFKLGDVQTKTKYAANYTPLDPLSFLMRSSVVFAGKTAIIDRKRSYTYKELSHRVRSFATILMKNYNINQGARVAVLCQNITPHIESNYFIPAAGGVIVPINTRLSAKEIEYIIEHSGAKLLFLQKVFEKKITDVVRLAVQIIQIADSDDPLDDPYEKMIASCTESKTWNELHFSQDENSLISINYTSGSTGKPKGVMATYRGIYLMALSQVVQNHLSLDSVYLWTLPIFHCNGWGAPWAVVATGGKQITLNTLDYSYIWDLLLNYNVTHYNAAPTVNTEICKHKKATRLANPVRVLSGGSVLSSKLIADMVQLNLQPTQIYGLTETHGPSVYSYDISTISEYTEETQYKLLARQGYSNLVSNELRVLDSSTGLDVISNGKDIGEVCFSGNLVMKGYYKNPKETAKSFKDGVFWSGDLGVKHPDGTIEVVDRKKDVIVSGGENISSLEVEDAIIQIDAVLECAIVGKPHKKWGERPVAFVVLKDGKNVDGKMIISYCRSVLAEYKCPDEVIFLKELPRTSTGKVQKFVLREEFWKNSGKSIG